jgi:hypothetical protein
MLRIQARTPDGVSRCVVGSGDTKQGCISKQCAPSHAGRCCFCKPGIGFLIQALGKPAASTRYVREAVLSKLTGGRVILALVGSADSRVATQRSGRSPRARWTAGRARRG